MIYGPKYDQNTNTTVRTAIGTVADTTKNHAHVIGRDNPKAGRATLEGTLWLVGVRVSAIVTATQLTVLPTADAAGDYPIAPATTVDLEIGLTTTTKGTALIKFQAPMFNDQDSKTVYLQFATDAGTLTVDSTTVFWSLT